MTSPSSAQVSVPTSKDEIKANLATVEQLIEKVNNILRAGREPTDAEITEIRNAIKELVDTNPTP